MKIVVFGPQKRTGVLRDAEVIDITYAVAKRLAEREGKRDSLPLADALASSELGRLIEGGQQALEIIEQALDHLNSSAHRDGPNGEQIVFDAGAVKLHAPRPRGARVACAGGNFADHSQAMAERRAERGEGAEEIGDPRERVRNRGFWGFWKVDRDSVGHDGQVIYPQRAARLDYEGELAIVLGKEGKNIRADDLADYIWGVTLLGDWSIRLAPEHGTPLNFAMQKNFDTSCSIGPCILVGEPDALNAEIETLVNNQCRQRFNANDMVFSYGEFLEYLSRDFTFYPGDMISGGTGAGTAADSSPTLDDGKPAPDRFLKPGDIVDIRSPAIGTLRSHIVAR
jgi:2-keto-4-pentenoate hydratase/2-oxohepta-3-ene-1,7-dioic acid hydratase in catechol pathway